MCHITDQEIQSDGQVLSTALNNVAKLLPASEATVATDLQTAASKLLQVTSTWTTGSVVADFNDAASVAEAALGAVPQTAAVAPLIPIAVSALDLLIANVGHPSENVTVASVKASVARVDALPPNPYRGKAVIPHQHFRSLRDDIKAAWDQVTKVYPELAPAKL